MKKVIITNVVILVMIIALKIQHIYSINSIPANIRGIGEDFFNFYAQISDDVIFKVQDFSVYILLIGFAINLYFLYRYNKDTRQSNKIKSQ